MKPFSKGDEVICLPTTNKWLLSRVGKRGIIRTVHRARRRCTVRWEDGRITCPEFSVLTYPTEHTMKFKLGDEVIGQNHTGDVHHNNMRGRITCINVHEIPIYTVRWNDGDITMIPDCYIKAAKPTIPPLDFTKPLQTLDGKPVRILCTDAEGKYPVIGYFIESGNSAQIAIHTWKLNGIWHDVGKPNKYDLIQAKTKHERWVNCYADHDHDVTHTNEESANCGRAPGRIACVKIEFET